MFKFIKKMFSKKTSNDRKQRALQRHAEGDGATGTGIATATSPEGTPLSRAAEVANDPNVDVRLALVARLVKLMPGLAPDKHSQLYSYAVQALQALAQDEVLIVRRALSSALKDYAKAPPTVVARLARDVEREISEPILRFCVALDDDELLDILASHPEPWVISAIAGRPEVSENVSEAVVKTRDVPGTAVLIGNNNARLLPATLESIVEMARLHPDLHRPLAMRSDVTVDIARQLAGFVNEAILDVLKDRSDFDAPTRRGIVALVGRRMAFMADAAKSLSPEQKLAKYAAAKALTPELIQDALAWHEREFVILALAHLSHIPPEKVQQILGSGSAKAIVALSWKAQLPPRLSLDIQRIGGRIQPKDLLYPKGGTDYPLTQQEIAWQLEFFGVRT
ncbi:MAG: DUF2336 domain-containing protein [Micavibrio sp.]|nr:DUF2336 domain-containing protein [Micavibrio sp.]